MMKLKFKKQTFQPHAVEVVVDCFAGQPRSSGIQCGIDSGRAKPRTYAVNGSDFFFCFFASLETLVY